MDKLAVAQALRIAAAALNQGTVVNAALPPTVNSFLHILLSHLTQYDMKMSAKDGNVYRLGHLLGAAGKVAKDMEGKLESQDEEDLDLLKQSLSKRFTEGFRPVMRTIKAIDDFINDNKLPKYPVPKGATPKAV